MLTLSIIYGVNYINSLIWVLVLQLHKKKKKNFFRNRPKVVRGKGVMSAAYPQMIQTENQYVYAYVYTYYV